MKVGSLFTGIGGFDLGLERAGMEIVWQVEIDKFCNKVLEKHWPNVKRYGDIKNVGREFEPVDLICGGPPCQPASCAGKRRGTEDDRWLWDETLRVTSIIKPKWCLFENPTGILSLQGGVPFENVLLKLESQGYAVQTFIIPACALNAPHRRDRVWIVACNATGNGLDRGTDHKREGHVLYTAIGTTKENQREGDGWELRTSARNSDASSDAFNEGLQGSERRKTLQRGETVTHGPIAELFGNSAWSENWFEVAARLCTLDDGLPSGLARPRGWRNAALKATGNAVLPQIVTLLGLAIMEIENHG